jgi:hypothetical protein
MAGLFNTTFNQKVNFMQYVQISPSEYVEVAEGSELLASIMSVPKSQRMTLLPASAAPVVAYLAAQAKAANLAQAKQANKKAAQEKLAKATGLTTDEMKALWG